MDKNIFKTKKPIMLSKKRYLGKNSIIVTYKNKNYVQGQKPISDEILDDLIKNGYLYRLESISEIFINDYVIPNEEYLKIKKIHSKAKKELKPYTKILETINTWVFLSKGSSAVNLKDEIEFQKNRELILSETILRGGIKSKPGFFAKNRGNRHEAYSIESDWLVDESTLLSHGIRKSDYCSMSEQVKIYNKIITQVISMVDCPKDFKDYFISVGFVVNDKHTMDYIPDYDYKNGKKIYPKLYFNDFYKNEHHSKENGLEFCHIDPTQEFTTNVNNVTIGSSKANRLQGGYSLTHLKNIFG